MVVKNMINVQIVLVICMLVGFVAGKRKMVTDSGRREITEIIMTITLPASIIASFVNTSLSPALKIQSITVFVLEIIIQSSMIVLGLFLFPKKWFSESERKSLRYSLINSNAAFIGMSLLSGILGDLGALLGAVAMIPKRITLWTAGLSIFIEERSMKKKLKKVLLHPSVVAVYIGILCMLLPVQYPAVMLKTLNTIGGSTTFLAMFAVGFLVSQMDFHGLLSGKILYFCLIRLVLIPLAIFIPLRLLRCDPVILTVCVVLAAVPAGSYTALMTAKYNGDVPFASKMVLVSTLLSVITIPLICSFI